LISLNAHRPLAVHSGYMGDAQSNPTLNCPICGKPMRFMKAIPSLGALPELWTFLCKDCDEMLRDTKANVLKSIRTGVPMERFGAL
jgi:hypothetical protein